MHFLKALYLTFCKLTSCEKVNQYVEAFIIIETDLVLNHKNIFEKKSPTQELEGKEIYCSQC